MLHRSLCLAILALSSCAAPGPTTQASQSAQASDFDVKMPPEPSLEFPLVATLLVGGIT